MEKRMKFTHNMKVLVIDPQENIVENAELLYLIKEKLREPYTQIITIPNISHQWKVTVFWEFKPLTKLQSYFMGDLFACPSYSFENLIYEHTEKRLKQIEVQLKNEGLCNIQDKIRFHISKMPDEICLSRENNVTI